MFIQFNNTVQSIGSTNRNSHLNTNLTQEPGEEAVDLDSVIQAAAQFLTKNRREAAEDQLGEKRVYEALNNFEQRFNRSVPELHNLIEEAHLDLRSYLTLIFSLLVEEGRAQ